MDYTPILAPLTGLAGTLLGLFINKLFSRKKDAVDYQTTVIENLWKEIGRLQEQILQLQSREVKAEEKEAELQKRISYLEHENRKQSSEIKELRRKLNERNTKDV
jgi:peptidoglycan hydrolase CwlO-like protein